MRKKHKNMMFCIDNVSSDVYIVNMIFKLINRQYRRIKYANNE